MSLWWKSRKKWSRKGGNGCESYIFIFESVLNSFLLFLYDYGSLTVTLQNINLIIFMLDYYLLIFVLYFVSSEISHGKNIFFPEANKLSLLSVFFGPFCKGFYYCSSWFQGLKGVLVLSTSTLFARVQKLSFHSLVAVYCHWGHATQVSGRERPQRAPFLSLFYGHLESINHISVSTFSSTHSSTHCNLGIKHSLKLFSFLFLVFQTILFLTIHSTGAEMFVCLVLCYISVPRLLVVFAVRRYEHTLMKHCS